MMIGCEGSPWSRLSIMSHVIISSVLFSMVAYYASVNNNAQFQALATERYCLIKTEYRSFEYFSLLFNWQKEMSTFRTNAGDVLTDFTGFLFHDMRAVRAGHFNRSIQKHFQVIKNSHKIYLADVFVLIVFLLFFFARLLFAFAFCQDGNYGLF